MLHASEPETVNRRLPIGGVFAIPGELHSGNEVTQAEVFIRIAQANHVRARERHRLLTNMYLPRSGPISSSVYLRASERARAAHMRVYVRAGTDEERRAYLRLPTRARLTSVHVPLGPTYRSFLRVFR